MNNTTVPATAGRPARIRHVHPRQHLRSLIIIERAWRGAAETQFADALYFVRELNRQFGGMDLLLRGRAVLAALDVDGNGPLVLGSRVLDTLPDPRVSIRTMLGEGLGVLVEETDLAAVRHVATAPLIPGVTRVGAGQTALSWADRLGVWFL
jgi:hypothetical protein